MLRIAIGPNGLASSVSKDGELLPAYECSIHMAWGQPTRVWVKMREADGKEIKEYEKVFDLEKEPFQIEVVQ